MEEQIEFMSWPFKKMAWSFFFVKEIVLFLYYILLLHLLLIKGDHFAATFSLDYLIKVQMYIIPLCKISIQKVVKIKILRKIILTLSGRQIRIRSRSADAKLPRKTLTGLFLT